MTTHFLIDFFQTHYQFLEEEDYDALIDLGQKKVFKAGEVYINLNHIQRVFGVVEQGLMRGYYIKDDGTEVTTIFAKEKDIVSSHEMMFHNEPSRQIIEALEDTVIYEFQYEAVEQLVLTNPRVEHLKNEIVQCITSKMLRRLETFLLNNPEERYRWLMEERSDLLLRVPLKHLASFIGITPVSLSRLRNRLNKKR